MTTEFNHSFNSGPKKIQKTRVDSKNKTSLTLQQIHRGPLTHVCCSFSTWHSSTFFPGYHIFTTQQIQAAELSLPKAYPTLLKLKKKCKPVSPRCWFFAFFSFFGVVFFISKKNNKQKHISNLLGGWVSPHGIESFHQLKGRTSGFVNASINSSWEGKVLVVISTLSKTCRYLGLSPLPRIPVTTRILNHF